VTATANYLRSLSVVLVRNRRRLLVILTAWALMALIAWDFSPPTGSYVAGFKAGCVFVFVIFGTVVTAGFVRDVIRQTVSR
jgi:hypothetical protein